MGIKKLSSLIIQETVLFVQLTKHDRVLKVYKVKIVQHKSLFRLFQLLLSPL